jgi:hypothetical protein
MNEWLWHVSGSICGVFAALQFIGGLWFMLEMRRKWRSVPELWSIDWLDIVYRLQREFRIKFTGTDFEGLSADARVELTAGLLWDLVAARVGGLGWEVPADGWERVVGVLSEALNVKPRQITPGSRLYADLGMVYGLGP